MRWAYCSYRLLVRAMSLLRLRMAVRGGGVGARAGVRGRDGAPPTGLVVLEGLDELGAAVHDERTVGHHGLPDRPAAEEHHIHGGVGSLLAGVRLRRHGICL